MPRIVKARLVSGRSVPVSIGGVMHRMRAGDEALDIPFEVYRSHAWKMELVGDSLGQVQTAMHEGEQVQSAPTQVPQAKVKEEEEPLPEWDIIMPPEDYARVFGKKKNPSKTVQARLDLARRIMAVKERDGKAK